MTDNVNWRNVLSAEVVRQIDADLGRQFAEGWAACQRAVAALTPGRSMDTVPALPPEADTRAYPSQRAPRGFWSGLLDEEARERFPDALPLKEAMRAVQARTDQFRLARSSLNVAIQTLEREGKMRREGKKLFWNPPASDVGRTGGDAAAESEDDDRSAAAISPFFRRLDDAAA